MEVMEQARAMAEQRQEEASGKRFLFDAEEMPPSQFYDELRNRYLTHSLKEVGALLSASKRVLYDDLWAAALNRPLVWEADVKAWIANWQQQGLVSIDGLRPRERVPKRESNHYVIWLGR